MVYKNGLLDGCFDLLHFGHINSIYQSKIQCNFLHVATHSDEEIYFAKNNEPIFDFNHRLLILKNCKFIDKLYNESTKYNTSLEIINTIKCDILFNGDNFLEKKHLLELYNVNKLCVIQRTKGISTSDILKRLYNYKHNITIKFNDNFDYLTNLYNNIVNINKIHINENIIFLRCNWDVFNKNHIYLIHNIKKKYDKSYKLIIDLTSYDNNIFNKFEIRVLLAGIIGIYDIIINNDIIKFECNNLILLNSNLNLNLFKFNEYIFDNDFNDDINKLEIYKKNIIDNIDFVKYKDKINNI